MSVTPLFGLFLLDAPWGKVLLTVHLLIAAAALGAATHFWWEATVFNPVREPRLKRYAKWSAIFFAISWFFGVFIYPMYNAGVRMKGNPAGLDAAFPWATGLFEYKEDFATVALMMLPWLLISAYRFTKLGKVERLSFRAAVSVFTLIVYGVFIVGGLVTMVKGMA